MSANKLQYKKMTIEELVVLSQQNDFKALEELIKREQKNIFATFSYLSRKRENIADLTQEALLRVAKNIQSLKNPKHFKSWLNQIVTNLFYDELRKNSRKPDIISIDEESDEDTNFSLKSILPDKKCKPPEKCITAEMEEIIKKEIKELPEPFRVAIVLRELQGLSYEEIARATNSSVGTVKSRISRARLKLQNGLKAYI
ncbi:sigma-70 family RNA polymerase sigma factor [Spirochaetes bacterium]|uniref:Sigma-70 family RNA polymerase sigma factor n=1 Tax=Candidatus Scatousia excrementipullorum TaxID=2840936 RepID=A0A9D9GY06_9BACT|nr:sigma-70 family RNA polymerase sigma factor [Candidatus Scatousia excrementipullorum]